MTLFSKLQHLFQSCTTDLCGNIEPTAYEETFVAYGLLYLKPGYRFVNCTLQDTMQLRKLPIFQGRGPTCPAFFQFAWHLADRRLE